jgi:hypothetical protein
MPPQTSGSAAHAARALVVRSHLDVAPPIVVLGMHRSGTSILTRMLQVCGVHIGPRLDRNFESLFLRGLNVRLLRQAGAEWYAPEPYRRQRADPAFHAECVRTLDEALRARFAPRFLGWTRRVRLPGAAFPWGWKDPRTCLTMDAWLEVFPEARVVHVIRHPLDVALSLQRREEQRRAQGKHPCPPVVDLNHNLGLWETYVQDGLRYRRLGDRYHELRYEDLLADAPARLGEILAACHLEPPRRRVARAGALVDSARTRRFEGDEYADARRQVAALVGAREFGYE